MDFFPPNEAVERIEQHLDVVTNILIVQAQYQIPRVQEIFVKFKSCLSEVYQSGEGWIEEDVHRIVKAAQFAIEKHQKQVRKDLPKTPYIVHPLSVACHLILIGNVRDPNILIAGLLHDTLEDTETSRDELVQNFGIQVADLVQEVSDDKRFSREERKKLQVIKAPQKSAGAAQIKLADKLDNLLDLFKYQCLWDEKRKRNYFDWSKEVISALPWVNRGLLKAIREVIERGPNFFI